MIRWIWMDYVTEGGESPVADWFRGILPGARGKLETRMSGLPIPDWHYSWSRPYKGVDGIFELKALYKNIQYRPLFCYGPTRGKITILIGAIEKGDSIHPKNAPKAAEFRKRQIKKNPRRVKIHEFPEDELF